MNLRGESARLVAGTVKPPRFNAATTADAAKAKEIQAELSDVGCDSKSLYNLVIM